MQGAFDLPYSTDPLAAPRLWKHVECVLTTLKMLKALDGPLGSFIKQGIFQLQTIGLPHSTAPCPTLVVNTAEIDSEQCNV